MRTDIWFLTSPFLLSKFLGPLYPLKYYLASLEKISKFTVELVLPGNTAFLINVGRGPLVDYDALIWALEKKEIAGVGLDVFWQEPPDPDDPIFRYNTVATPHIGGSTDISLNQIAQAVAENINRVRRGEAPLNCINLLVDQRKE